jgi:hypothetical protein
MTSSSGRRSNSHDRRAPWRADPARAADLGRTPGQSILSDFSCPQTRVYAAKSLQMANYVTKRQPARPHPGDRDLVDNATAT